ncbi:hypothetical protein GCM10027515_19980 [Schumannella luteola]|uniref:CAAX prenyl protease 2/Lysostaphin resistance protein A-like domain-containing protein n=1 Tax=Schumannella luteola TaxID=472059 RepID=A0A852YB80_9MICO|nr:hypothetical protein [Schumannella luteola]
MAVPVVVALYLGTALLTLMLPSDGSLPGLANFAISAAVPAIAFGAAVVIRIRRVQPFGLRRVRPWWILAAIGIGIANVALSWPVAALIDPLVPGAGDVQQSYRDSSMAGPAGLIATIVLGGMLTPLGEELFFRGVITRFLLRWNTAIAVILGAAIFAAAHGVNDVTPMAFIIGLGNGLLLRYSRSIWPGVAVHVTYNTIGMVIHSLGI